MSVLSPEQELRRLLARYEENPRGRAFAPLADAYRKAARFEEALRLCREGIALHPRYSSAYVILGKIHLERGEDQLAREAFEHVLTLDPQNLLALRHLALQAEQRGDHAQALRCWEQIAAADPEAQDARDHLASSSAEPRASGGAGELVAEARARLDGDGAALLTAMSNAEGPTTPPPALSPMPRGESKVADAPLASTASDIPSQTGSRTSGPPAASAAAVAPDADSTPATSADERSRAATEIATITLADIYSEQGFKAKALEIYRSVQARAPHRAPELSQKIAHIEDEMRTLQEAEDRLQARVQQAMLTDRRPTRAGEASAAPGDDGRRAASSGTAAPSLPGAAPASKAAGEGGADDPDEPENFDHFQSWLKKMKLRNP